MNSLLREERFQKDLTSALNSGGGTHSAINTSYLVRIKDRRSTTNLSITNVIEKDQDSKDQQKANADFDQIANTLVVRSQKL